MPENFSKSSLSQSRYTQWGQKYKFLVGKSDLNAEHLNYSSNLCLFAQSPRFPPYIPLNLLCFLYSNFSLSVFFNLYLSVSLPRLDLMRSSIYFNFFIHAWHNAWHNENKTEDVEIGYSWVPTHVARDKSSLNSVTTAWLIFLLPATMRKAILRHTCFLIRFFTSKESIREGDWVTGFIESVFWVWHYNQDWIKTEKALQLPSGAYLRIINGEKFLDLILRFSIF